MALSVFKTFSSGEILTASDLNSSLTQFTDNALTLISPLTGVLDFSTYAGIFSAGSSPTVSGNEVGVFAEDVNSQAELKVRDESGQETQLTNSGDLVFFHEVFS